MMRKPWVRCDFPEIGNNLDHGICVRSGSWDGADICKVRGYDINFVSERAALAMLDFSDAKHFCFVRPADYCRWDEFDVRRWTSVAYKKHVESFLIRRRSQVEVPR